MTEPRSAQAVTVDMISDVVCPWCVIGFLNFRQAVAAGGRPVRLRWHPFELNPQMPAGGQALTTHMAQKYGTSSQDSAATRARITKLGADLGFRFDFVDDARIVNTFRAHQLLEWALLSGRQTELKLALFTAYFTDGRDVSDRDVLLDVAQSVGLERAEAATTLDLAVHAGDVRDAERGWIENGVRSVPTTIFAGQIVHVGVQSPSTYAKTLTKAASLPPAV